MAERLSPVEAAITFAIREAARRKAEERAAGEQRHASMRVVNPSGAHKGEAA